tara:strand:+ start:280 stop:555 length:276 start_codon:yes stop_codon:yes gene_type:complete
MNQEELMSYIQEEVDKHWQLPSRPDLREDCVNYVWENWTHNDDIEAVYDYDEICVLGLIIQFLSNHCREAVSSQDIEYMAIAEKERLLTMT